MREVVPKKGGEVLRRLALCEDFVRRDGALEEAWDAQSVAIERVQAAEMASVTAWRCSRGGCAARGGAQGAG